MKPYNKANIPLAKSLRKNMTPWERKLEVLRICNLDIDRNFSGVCEWIDATVKRAMQG